MSNKAIAVCGSAVIIGLIVGYLFIPARRAEWNTIQYNVQKADDSSRYSVRKQVEDTCRAMITSYEADCITYEQYKGSENEEKQSWAEQAKIRANKTAAAYNNYILKNSFIWQDNIPDDIREALEYIE